MNRDSAEEIARAAQALSVALQDPWNLVVAGVARGAAKENVVRHAHEMRVTLAGLVDALPESEPSRRRGARCLTDCRSNFRCSSATSRAGSCNELMMARPQ